MDFSLALAKAQKYCAYQERSCFEVKRKLFQWDVDENNSKNIIEALKKDNFVSEQRFAELYARSKVHQKKWGKIKIRIELLRHEVPEKIIADALDKIIMKEYYENLRYLAGKKQQELSAKNTDQLVFKLKSYLHTKGYESDLINEIAHNKA